MRTNRYSFSRAKTNFRTKEIAVRGFVRDLKSRLLEGFVYSLEEPEYRLVADAFDLKVSRLDISLLTEFYDQKQNEYKISFVDSSCYSKWWNGRQYPDKRNRKLIEILFPGLLCKWFERSNFKNRMQLHLASMDLFHLSRNCNCPVKEEHDKELDSYCDKCLSQALNEAEWILKEIHKDWQPIHSGYFNAFDVCIAGPQARSGLNVAKNLFESRLSQEVRDDRAQINYDLSLGDGSFVGLPLPREIINLCQSENPFSIVLFLFSLVCLDFRTESEYRNDLTLDFMTALNCAGLLLYAKHGRLFGSQSDFMSKSILEMLLNVSEYFYDQPFDLNELLLSYEKLCKQAKETGGALYGDIVHPITHFSGYPGFKLTEMFFDIVRLSINDQNIETFMENLEEFSYSTTYEESKVDDYLKSPYLRVFKSLELARERYLNLFDIVGYPRNELIAELSKTVCSPMNTKIVSDTIFQKHPSYSAKYHSRQE